MKGQVPAVDFGLCMACGVCAAACPFGALDLTAVGRDRANNAYPETARPEACTGCGLCVKACPVDCLTLVPRS